MPRFRLQGCGMLTLAVLGTVFLAFDMRRKRARIAETLDAGTDATSGRDATSGQTPLQDTFTGGDAVPGWNDVGVYDLLAGPVRVPLSDRTAGEVVAADAIRWLTEPD